MTKSSTKLVTERELDSGGKEYDFRCPYPSGCGEAGGDPFSSVGWADRDHAVARGKQHIAEHEGGEPMQDLDSFRSDHGVTSDNAGASVQPSDWEF